MLITVISSGNLEIGESASDWRIELLIIHYSIAMIMHCCCVNALLNALLCNCGDLWELLIKMHNNNNELMTSYAMLIFIIVESWRWKYENVIFGNFPNSINFLNFSLSHSESVLNVSWRIELRLRLRTWNMKICCMNKIYLNETAGSNKSDEKHLFICLCVAERI